MPVTLSLSLSLSLMPLNEHFSDIFSCVLLRPGLRPTTFEEADVNNRVIAR